MQHNQGVTRRADNRLGGIARRLDFCFTRFELVDIHQRQHRAIDLVIQGQIGAYAQRVPAAFEVLHLALAHGNGVDHVANQIFKINRLYRR